MHQRVNESEISDTQCMQVGKELETEKSKLDSIVNSIPSGIDIVSYDYRVQFQNKFLLDRFGDIRGKLCYREYMGRDKPCSDCTMRRAIENNRTELTELIGADGRNYELVSSPIKNPDGTMSAVEVIMDITERKQVERALQESEEKYRKLFENANDAIFIADTKTGTILDANRQAEQLIGRPRQEIIGMHQSKLHPPHYAEYYEEKFHKHVQKGHTFDLEAEVIKKDGSIVPVVISANVINLRGKKLIQGIFRDITQERKILDLKEEIETRKLIEKAKGILMDRHRIPEKEAVRRLQKESRRQSKKLKQIAQGVVSSELLLN